MGGAAAEPAKGGKKSMDANINLVPYIDLLMTIMTFLVMTAVWTQIAALEVVNSSGNTPDDPDDKKDQPKPIFVIVTSSEVKIQEEGAEPKTFTHVDNLVDRAKLGEELERLRQLEPERKDVKIKAEGDVLFENVATAIDVVTGTCRDKADKSSCLTQITLNPA